MPLEIAALNLFGVLPRPDHFSLFLLGFAYLGIAGARLSTMFAPIISAKEKPRSSAFEGSSANATSACR
ncbi:MAG: hypothetical protein MUQ93_09120, partial [Planktomarina temperata]|nr:hypothetical protein [Planktomarina temperata]